MCNQLRLATYPDNTIRIDLSARRITEHLVTATLEVDFFVSCSRAENKRYFPPVGCARLEYNLRFMHWFYTRKRTMRLSKASFPPWVSSTIALW